MRTSDMERFIFRLKNSASPMTVQYKERERKNMRRMPAMTEHTHQANLFTFELDIFSPADKLFVFFSALPAAAANMMFVRVFKCQEELLYRATLGAS